MMIKIIVCKPLQNCITFFLKEIQERLNAEIITEISDPDPETLYICFQKIPGNISNCILFSTEQQTTKVWEEVNTNNLQAEIIWDYSYENAEIINSFGKQVKVLEPFYINKDSYEKTKNFILLESPHQYRKDIIKNYLEGLEYTNFYGNFEEERRNMLREHKVLINIHADDDYRICETFRVYEALACGCIVVSQRCYREDLVSLKDYIHFVDDHELKEKSIFLAENYEKYKPPKNIFENILKVWEQMLN